MASPQDGEDRQAGDLHSSQSTGCAEQRRKKYLVNNKRTPKIP